MPLSPALRQRITDLVSKNRVLLFMKGNRRFPQCGFSSAVVGILDELLPAYETVNVLTDPELREGIKEFSQWPTIPQLYIDGQFVGGCDIVREMHTSGELGRLLGVSTEVTAPKITLTDAAARAFRESGYGEGDEALRLEISPRFEVQLYFAPRDKGDLEATSNGITIALERSSARRADGITIDFVEGPSGAGFKIDNPNAPPAVKPLLPKALKEMLDQNKAIYLFDVRTETERAIAKIEGARLLDEQGEAFLNGLPKDATLVFHCHHGRRSQAAAEHFLSAGYKDIYNLEGGIDAWSLTVDPSVPRY